MKSLVTLAILVAASLAGQQSEESRGLLAHYTFDEGGGVVAHDSSGNGNDARIVGCLHVKSDRGFALDFNGVGPNPTNHVVCPDLDITGGLTISTWVFAYTWSASDWSGIVYKSDQTYGIRNFYMRPGAIHFRVDGRDLVSQIQLEPQRWYHLAAVFEPGSYMRLYINGRLDSAQIDNIPTRIPTDDSPLLVGACGNQYFAGRMDDIRIYGRALGAEEVRALYTMEAGAGAALDEPAGETAEPSVALEREGCRLSIYPRGGIEIAWRDGLYRLSSAYSARGGYRNLLSLSKSPASTEEKAWSPAVRAADDAIEVSATGASYRLTRRVSIAGARVTVTDTFSNIASRDIGIEQWHSVNVIQPLQRWFLFGVENATGPHDPRTPAVNPTLFVSQAGGSLGILVEDDVVRNQLEGTVSPDERTAKLGTRHFALPAGETRTVTWTIYLSGADYFDFINLVRTDLDVPRVTIPGPAAFLRVATRASDFYRNEMAPHPDVFRRYLQRKRITVFLMCPWFRYWDGFDLGDDEFKKTMQDAMKTVRAVEPDAKFLACLETYYYYVPRSILGDTVPQQWEEWSRMPNEFALPPAATRIIDNTPWRDSVYRDANGNVIVSRSDPGADSDYKTPPLCLCVYPEIREDGTSNYFFRLRMDEINYLLDEVGFDGVYMDMFGYGGGNHTFERWDRQTVDIGPDGEITRKYADLATLTARARQVWLENIIARGKIALVNFGQPNTRSLQRIPYLSFVEAADIGHVDLQAPIPDSSGAAGCQLTAPIALAAGRPGSEVADKVLARMRAFLRYGVLYYHYRSDLIFPESGEGSGEYGPINHMFPITPMRLGKGFVIGEERIVTTVSRDFEWHGRSRPRVLLFDELGRPRPHAIEPVRADDGWIVPIRLTDWRDTAIVAAE